MPKTSYVLVSDPSGELPEGFVFSNPLQLSKAEAAGAMTLPVDDDLVPGATSNPCDGFSIKSWGAGWVVDRNVGERACPMVLRILPDRPHVWWMARVVAVRANAGPTGKIRLVPNSSSPLYASGGLSQITSPQLIESEPVDKWGGYTLVGCSRVNVIGECLFAFDLHAVARNARILWSAVSLCQQGPAV